MSGAETEGPTGDAPYWPVGAAADRAGVSHRALAEDVRRGRIRARSRPREGSAGVEVRTVRAEDVVRCYPAAARFLEARTEAPAGAVRAEEFAAPPRASSFASEAVSTESPRPSSERSAVRPAPGRRGGTLAVVVGGAVGLAVALTVDVGAVRAALLPAVGSTPRAEAPEAFTEDALTNASGASAELRPGGGAKGQPVVALHPIPADPGADLGASDRPDAFAFGSMVRHTVQERTSTDTTAVESIEAVALSPSMPSTATPSPSTPSPSTSSPSAPLPTTRGARATPADPWESGLRAAWQQETDANQRLGEAVDATCAYEAQLATLPSHAATALGPCYGPDARATHRVHGVPCCAHHAFVERRTGASSDERARTAVLAEAEASMGDGALPALLVLRAERSAAAFLRGGLSAWDRAGLDEGAGASGAHRWSLRGRRAIDGDPYLALRLDSWVQRAEDSPPRAYRLELLLGSGARGDRLESFRWADEESLAGAR